MPDVPRKAVSCLAQELTESRDSISKLQQRSGAHIALLQKSLEDQAKELASLRKQATEATQQPATFFAASEVCGQNCQTSLE